MLVRYVFKLKLMGRLHRGTYSCATEICMGFPTDRYLGVTKSMLALLQRYNITPILVVDGGEFPAKKKENEERKKYVFLEKEC